MLHLSPIEQFRKSEAWDSQYNLPTCPMHNNPWIYMAYAQMLLRLHDETLSQEQIEVHRFACKVSTQEAGLYHRWPGGRGGVTSYDELMGMAYLSTHMADCIVSYLYRSKGIYNNVNEKHWFPLRFYVYRFIFLKPFLKWRAERHVNWLQKLAWCSYIFIDSFSGKVEGGRLKTYLMVRVMHTGICGVVGRFWKRRMRAHGVTLKACFALEPKEYPIYTELAPRDFP